VRFVTDTLAFTYLQTNLQSYVNFTNYYNLTVMSKVHDMS